MGGGGCCNGDGGPLSCICPDGDIGWRGKLMRRLVTGSIHFGANPFFYYP